MSLDQSAVVPLTGGAYEIDHSLRFNDDDSAYLSWTPSSAGNRKIWTFSWWFKPALVRTNACSFFSSNYSYQTIDWNDNNTGTIRLFLYEPSPGYVLAWTPKYRDPSAWYHCVIKYDTTQATASDRVKLYVNGEQITDLFDSRYPAQNWEGGFNNSIAHNIGRRASDSSGLWDGYMSEVHFIDGQALDSSYFGETGDYGEWKPIEYTGSYGTNGFYLDFGGTYYNDKSGNGNNFTATNLATTDVVVDSPTNNFSTWNVLGNINGDTFSEGNLKVVTASSPYSWTPSSIGVSSGKVYAEFLISSSSGYDQIGIATGVSTSTSTCLGCTSETYGYTSYNGQIRHNDNSYSFGNTFTTGDLIGVAVDFDNEYIYWSKNGTWQNSGDPTSGSSGTGGFSLSSISGKTVFFGYSDFHGSGSGTYVANFGQDSSFAGNKTAQGNQDDNGIGDFYYTPPSGYLALCTSNLSDPAVIPSEHFNTVLHTGNNNSTRSITGVGFQPDLVWHKARNQTWAHLIYDSIRGTGANAELSSQSTGSEGWTNADEYGYLSSFDSDGFTASQGSAGWAYFNASAGSFVTWNWKANGSGSSNTNGTITSTVSANQDAGFSIVSYSGTGSNATIGHGLSQAPEMIIVKKRNDAGDWMIYHEGLGGTKYIRLNLTNGSTISSTAWQDTDPTNTKFYVGTDGAINGSGNTYISYCFHSVDGFSKVGSYTGNGSSDGTFVYTGFRPQFILFKCFSASGEVWMMYDGVRVTDNPVNKRLRANGDNVEASDSDYDIDFLANGFKHRDPYNDSNGSGRGYIYIAFAEHPLKYTNAR